MVRAAPDARHGQPDAPPRLSVCVATFNGDQFIDEQLRSILVQLGAHDEVVIVDDDSSDSTTDLIEGMNDPRIQLIRNEANMGHVRTFERALRQATGEWVMLADQDDIWPEGRVDTMLEALVQSDFVLGSIQILGSDAKPALPDRSTRGVGIGNLLGILAGTVPYAGSAMAFRRSMLIVGLPFPAYVEAHDHWLAIVANVGFRVRHLEQIVLFRRLHGSNLTPRKRRGLKPVLLTRGRDLRSMFESWRRCRQSRAAT